MSHWDVLCTRLDTEFFLLVVKLKLKTFGKALDDFMMRKLRTNSCKNK